MSVDKPIKVFLIDDHPVTLAGLISWINEKVDGIEVGGSAIDVQDAIKQGIPEDVEVISLDLFIRNSNWIMNIHVLRKKYPHKYVIMFSSDDSPSFVRKMMQHGARAYLNKSISVDEYADTIRKVVDGEVLVPKVLTDLNDPEWSIIPHFSPEGFSERDKVVLNGLVAGKSYKEIAEELEISEAAVNKWSNRLKRKLNVKSSIQMIMRALKLS